MKTRVKSICSAAALAATLLVATALPAAAAPHAFARGGFGYRGAWRGGWGGWGGWGAWGGPWGYGYFPYYAPYPATVNPNAGKVKLDTKLKDAEVFINGAYAGTVREMKNMWMRQGSYKLEIRAPGREEFQSRIYVVPGKTIHIRPDLRVKS